ncbi:AAA family ATPase [Sutterella sp.]|uniref:AAA family ATPase n=1 Tax=Sutterella sp. TaxID=1981025 RepID=UPI0025F18BCE|nr:AAA family ATPase [uncultured Sutterella sp.]
MQPLPFGLSSFEAIRAGNAVYVDKTALLPELAQIGAKIFLARPRRFGKSLLVSTFKSLFAHGLRDFKGLAIEGLWNDRTYPVVHLDLSALPEFRSRGQFQSVWTDLLAANFATVGFRFDSASTISFWQQFRLWLRSLPVLSLVVLIDEYDAPLTRVINDEDSFNEVRDQLNEFFRALKECDGALRFFFMTGITKFSHTSIFSAFNNLYDISLEPQYGALLGWTEDEVKQCFGEYVGRASRALNVSTEEIVDGLRRNYDGFCFEQTGSVHVFCPWSVLHFLRSPATGFQNYWYRSGGQPTVLKNFLKRHAIANPLKYDVPLSLPLSELQAPRQYDELSLEVLLTQAGYLTIRSVRSDEVVFLGYPNEEVSVSLARLYSDELLRGRPMRGNVDARPAGEVLASGSLSDVVALFGDALNAIDYKDYPIKSEAHLRAYLQVLLIGAAMVPEVEKHSALGRSDLELNAGCRRWVFEFKYVEHERDVPKLLRKALEQLRERRYGETPHGRTLLRAALVFDGAKRRFAAAEMLHEESGCGAK